MHLTRWSVVLEKKQVECDAFVNLQQTGIWILL